MYCTGQKRYLDFLSRAGLRGVPASEGVVCKFVAQLATEGLKHRTIKSYMASPIRSVVYYNGDLEPMAGKHLMYAILGTVVLNLVHSTLPILDCYQR